MPVFSPRTSTASRSLRSWLTASVAAGALATLGLATPAKAASLLASWDFTQVGGVVTDQQDGHNDLSLTGNWSSVPESSNGPAAVQFNSAPAAAGSTTADGAHFNPGTGGFALTVELRATKDVTSGSPNVAQHGSFDSTGQIKMQLEPGGRVGCRIKGDRAAYLFYDPIHSVNDNQWHTVTCARSGTDLTVSFDGSTFSPAGAENPGSISINGAPLRFAQKPNSSSVPDQFIGDIAHASYSG